MKLLLVLSVVLVSGFSHASELTCISANHLDYELVAVWDGEHFVNYTPVAKSVQADAVQSCQEVLSGGSCVPPTELEKQQAEEDQIALGVPPGFRATFVAKNTIDQGLYASYAACRASRAAIAISAAKAIETARENALASERLIKDAGRANSIYNKL